MSEPFIHLHVHSNYSLCRGANSIEQICAAAQKMGMTHLALTDTNGLYGLVWFIETAKSYGLSPIIGAFLHTGFDHCVMLAKNMDGYRCLCHTLSALHCRENFDLASHLQKKRRDVVVLTDDLALLSRLLNHGDKRDLYVELIPHGNREKAARFARQHSLPVVASNSVYFVEAQDWETHRLLRAIDLNTTLKRVAEDQLAHRSAFLKDPEEMRALFPDIPSAVDNTSRIADECQFELRFKDFIFASVESPTGATAYDLLKEKVLRGARRRYGVIDTRVRGRLDYEMHIIEDKGFAPYFLVVEDVVKKAPRTCGRGSAAASVVSYCLGITHVDPIKYDLFFERFLNPGRIDPPDIDVDFPWDERDDILDYIFRKYGTACSAMISNHNSFKARSAVREVAKVYGIPDGEIGAVTKKMSGYWQPDNLWSLTQSHPVYRDTELAEPWPEIFSRAEGIRGFPRHLSVHCGGVVIAPDGLSGYVPIQPAKKILDVKGIVRDGTSGLPTGEMQKKNINIVQWEKDQAEEMGLIKMDILGNRSLAVIREAIKAVKDNYHIDIDYTSFNPLDDPKTIDLLKRGDTIGVFYVESPAMRQLQKKTGKGDFEHLVIHSSIIRPAANMYISEYIRRLKGGTYDPLHPSLQDILKETYGIMVYQEDVSKVAMALADFDAAEADDLRKIMAKKHKQRKLSNYRDKFYEGAKNRGIDSTTCDQIWNMILSFSGYSFCKPHSASYALVSFKSAYLRAHFPAEFIAAVISNQGGYYSSFAYVSEARRMGLTVMMPDINRSEKQYTGRDRSVRVGLMQLKGLSFRALESILDERKKNGKFKSFDDFLRRVTITPSDISILVKSGCFDALEPLRTRPELLWHMKWFHTERTRQKTSTLSLFEETAPSQAALPRVRNYDENTVLLHELETLGFLLSRHPLSLYKTERLDYIPAKDLHKHGNRRVRTIGWMITRKTVSTRQNKLMEFISFEDTTAIYETTFFPKAYNDFVHMMTKTRPYVLEGKVDMHFGAFSLTVDRVKRL